MKITLLIALIVSSISASSADPLVYKTSDSEYISFERFISEIPSTGHIVMGEFHNDPLIQNTQTKIIKDKITLENMTGQFSVMWEFLNYTDQEKIQRQYKSLKESKITVDEFISNTAGKQNLTYAPIFSVTAQYDGNIAGINLPRSLKQAVVKGGLGAISPEFIPQAHYTGDEDYLARFVAAMGAHVPAEKIPNYFLAQCLTDSVMAEQIHLNNTKQLNFIIAGSFHTDFYDGTVVRLKDTYHNVTTLKLVNINILSEIELNEIISGNYKYGVYADYILITQ
jgi:uncharacterized iron-regulated protein